MEVAQGLARAGAGCIVRDHPDLQLERNSVCRECEGEETRVLSGSRG